MPHIHTIIDTESHFTVNATSREISTTDDLPSLVQNDNNSERLTFVVPRWVDGHDLALCDKAEILYYNEQTFDHNPVKDLKVNPDNENTVILSWLISDKSTRTAGKLDFSIRFYCADNYVWNTKIFSGIKVAPGMPKTDEIGESEIDIAVNSAKEEYRNELETSIETATGESHDNKTWEELNNTVSTLPIITHEQTQALGEWDLIKDYFADYANAYHQLFYTGPTDADGNERTYSLPYIYTPKLQWRNGNIISPKLVEYGADVSKATTLCGGIFCNKNCLQRLVLTGNANAKSLYDFMHQATVLRYIKFETPSKGVLNEDYAYYKRAFLECYILETIDCELDFTGQTDTTYMFRGCNRLKNLRIKPFTLSTSLDLGTCRSLHTMGLDDYDSLVSILNGITDDIEVAKNITITFADEIRDPRFTTDIINEYTIWDKDVYYYTGDGLYHLEIPEVTDGNVYLELPLESAFSSKGVTLAWQR